MENVSFLKTTTRIYMLRLTSINGKQKNFESYRYSNKELNAQFKKKIQKFVKNKKRRKMEKELQHFQEL